jgi:hypothetical protein
MSRSVYWPLLFGCLLLTALFSQPAWTVVHACDLPVAGVTGQAGSSGQVSRVAPATEGRVPERQAGSRVEESLAAVATEF